MNRIPVLHHPNDELREKARELSVEEILSDEMQTLVDDMLKTMKDEDGVGLAATQIGKHIRLFVAETKQGHKAFFNPIITKTSSKMIDSEEGCLSVPGVYGIVKRHKQIKASALDRKGNPVHIGTGGLLAVIFQHEIDHLDGILFIDRAHKIHDLTPEKEAEILA